MADVKEDTMSETIFDRLHTCCTIRFNFFFMKILRVTYAESYISSPTFKTKICSNIIKITHLSLHQSKFSHKLVPCAKKKKYDRSIIFVALHPFYSPTRIGQPLYCRPT